MMIDSIVKILKFTGVELSLEDESSAVAFDEKHKVQETFNKLFFDSKMTHKGK